MDGKTVALFTYQYIYIYHMNIADLFYCKRISHVMWCSNNNIHSSITNLEQLVGDLHGMDKSKHANPIHIYLYLLIKGHK